MQFDSLVQFLVNLGAPFRLAPDHLLCVDFGWPVDREHLGLIRRAKKEALLLYLDDCVDAIREAAEDENGIADILLGGFIHDPFEGRDEASTPRAQAILVQHFYGKPLSRSDVRKWIRIAVAAAKPIIIQDRAAAGPLVYLITLDDPSRVKIGFTKNIAQRLRSLRTASPIEPHIHLTINGDRRLESELHQRFKADRIRREWFRLSPEIVAFIAAAAQR